MSSRWLFIDKPGKCLFCGKPLKMKHGSGYCSFDCQDKDISPYERAKIKAQGAK